MVKASLGILAAAVAVAVAFCWPLLGFPGVIGVQGDWDQYLVLHWVPYETVRQYGELPLWNPYVCGGMPMLGNPQSRWLSPFFLLHLAFGPAPALQLEIVAHIALAWAGAFVLGRTSGLSRVAALAPATIFAGCSYHYLHLAEGHVTWLAFAWLPWVLASAAAGRPVLAGLALALAIGEGGVYAVPLIVIALVVLAFQRAVTGRTGRPLLEVAIAGGIAAGVAAPKLLLVQSLMAQYPRLIESTERMGPLLMLDALVGRAQNIDSSAVPAGYEYGIHEYGVYVGPIALLLATAGVLVAGRRSVPWIALLAVSLALAAGTTLGGDSSPWALLHRLPVFSSLRIPSRVLILAALAIGMLAGLGLERLAASRGRRRLAAVVIILVVGVDLALVGPPNLKYLINRPAFTLKSSEAFTQIDDGEDRRMYAIVRANMGALDCYEPLKPAVKPVGAGEENYRGEAYLLDGGDVRRIAWSPNRMAFDVSSGRSNTLVINSNFDASWRVVSGTGEMVNYDGLLAIRVPAGSQQIGVAYRSTRFTAGMVIALATLAAIGVSSAINRRRASPAETASPERA